MRGISKLYHSIELCFLLCLLFGCNFGVLSDGVRAVRVPHSSGSSRYICPALLCLLLRCWKKRVYNISNMGYITDMEMKIRDIPGELHYQFKLLCVKKKISMNKYLRKMIEKEVEREDKKR